MLIALAFVGILTISCVTIILVGYMFAKTIGTLRTVKMEPKQIDDTPVMQCQECSGTWIKGMEPMHEGRCPVAYAKNEQRRVIP